jgi:hypothetical protein
VGADYCAVGSGSLGDPSLGGGCVTSIVCTQGANIVDGDGCVVGSDCMVTGLRSAAGDMCVLGGGTTSVGGTTGVGYSCR